VAVLIHGGVGRLRMEDGRPLNVADDLHSRGIVQ